LNPRDVLDRLRATYSSAQAYRDGGRVVVTSRADRGHEATTSWFRTSFVRAVGRFSFDFGDSAESKYRIRTEQMKIVDCSQSVGSALSLGRRIGSLAGVTSGASHTVPRMLLPERVPGRSITDAEEPSLLEDAPVEEEACWTVDVTSPAQSRTLVYVSKNDFTLRRIWTRVHLSDAVKAIARARGVPIPDEFDVIRIVTYAPAIRTDAMSSEQICEW
jgi:hypothetical protein